MLCAKIFKLKIFKTIILNFQESDQKNIPVNTDWIIYEFKAQNNILDLLRETIRFENCIIKIKVNSLCALERLDLNCVKNLALQFSNKSAIFSLTSKDTACHHIYWKSKDSNDFLFLEIRKDNFNEDVECLGEFVAEFLANSLENRHLGKQFFRSYSLMTSIKKWGFRNPHINWH